jgi:hypothetical protein
MNSTRTRTTYTVEVSGSWLDPRTRTQRQQLETYRILAAHEQAAQTAGLQLYGASAAQQHCIPQGRRFVRARA